MAILANIRQKSALLIVTLGLCLFAFVAQDLFTKSSFGGNSKFVGSVNGEDIDYKTFNDKVVNAEKGGRGMSNTQAVEQVWNNEVQLALVNAEIKKLGIRAGKTHVIDALKSNQNIGQNKMFQNEAGIFDIAKYNEYFKTNPEQKQFKDATELDAEFNSKIQFYVSLVKSGFNTTKTEAKMKYEAESNKVSFDFVSVPFSSIKDTEIKISDDELIDYMKKNEKKYKADESREIQYVLIENKASVEDENQIKNEINTLLPQFTAATAVSVFVNANSDKPYDSVFVAKKDLPAAEADKLMNLAVGQIYGPYMNDKFCCISKAMGRKSGVNARASHILIGWEGSQAQNQKEKRTKEQAKAKADGILAQAIANPGMFMMQAFQHSEDSSAQQGGDLGYFAQGAMVKPFNDFVFNNGTGKIGMVETQFGYHIINVTDKQDGIRLATIARKIVPSDKTENEIFTNASNFEMKANEADFEAVAKEMKLTVVPNIKFKAMEESVGALGAQRQIVRWAFSEDTNLNDVKRFEIPNVGDVIAKLKKVNPEGLLSIEDAKIQVEPILRNKKKAEKIMAKMKGSSLETIAAANKVVVTPAVDLTMENANIPNAGMEYKVVGTAFGLAANKTSAPIEGNSGVFVVRTKAVAKALPINDYTPYFVKLNQQNAGKANNFIEAIKKEADIKDNRVKFNY